MFKVKIGVAPDIMKEISEIYNRNCNFQHVFNLNDISIGPKIWDTLPDDWKDPSSLKSFKENLQVWIPENLPCTLCKNYFQRVGFF